MLNSTQATQIFTDDAEKNSRNLKKKLKIASQEFGIYKKNCIFAFENFILTW